MSNTCETVNIKTEAGNVRINKTDYKEGIHILAEESNVEGMDNEKSKVTCPDTKKEIQSSLKEAGIDFDSGSKKSELIELFNKSF